jgi:hypothetical protein
MNPTPYGPSISMTQRECERYSLPRYIRALATNDRTELSNFRSLSNQVAAHTGQPDERWYIPGDMLQTRTMTTVPGAKGGYLVSPSIAGFSNALARRSLIDTLPITRLQVANVGTVVKAQLATQNGVSWLAEGVSSTPAEETIGNVSMSPKTCLAAMDVSEQLMRVTDPAVAEYGLQRQLLTAVNEAWSTVLLTGSGSAEPLGIINTVGIDTRTGASFSTATAAAMVKVVESFDNGASVQAVASLDAAEVLRQRAKVTGGERFLVENGRLLDVQFTASRAMSGARLVVAPWSSVILCQWGALELDVDRSGGFNAATFRVRVLGFVDVGIERPAQIASASAIT